MRLKGYTRVGAAVALTAAALTFPKIAPLAEGLARGREGECLLFGSILVTATFAFTRAVEARRERRLALQVLEIAERVERMGLRGDARWARQCALGLSGSVKKDIGPGHPKGLRT